MFRAFLRGALAARLLSEAAWARHPGYAEVGIERPIFVTGLPRTGTTALHRLLAADPAHQGLEMWLTEVPQPRPPRETWAGDPVFRRIQAAYERHHVAHPEFMGVHYMAADQVEECWQLLRQSMRSVSYECLAHLPAYSAWLAGQDWTGAYRRHRRNLQLIGLPDRGRRWVLKNPSHLFALDALLRVYPDALVIQTHRDAAGRDRVGVQPRRAGVGRLVAGVHRRGDRPRPAGAVGPRPRAVHGRARQARPGAVLRRRLRRVHRRPRPHRRSGLRALRADAERPGPGRHEGTAQAQCAGRCGPAHRYALSDFGLTDRQVDERFAGYR